MNYLHPQLFFPISLCFFFLRPLVSGKGDLGPESFGENLTVNSPVRWSCHRHPCVLIFLCFNINLKLTVFLPFLWLLSRMNEKLVEVRLILTGWFLIIRNTYPSWSNLMRPNVQVVVGIMQYLCFICSIYFNNYLLFPNCWCWLNYHYYSHAAYLVA